MILHHQKTINCGVPQGSLLGPWCYLLYSNDIASCVKCTLGLYADDTILLTSHKNVTTVTENLSEAARNCYHWLSNNFLSMHMGKTEVIFFSSKRKRKFIKNLTISLCGNVIKPKQEVKYLGLKMDNTLSGDAVVKDIVTKCNNRLKFLYRHRDALDTKIRKTLAMALLQCHFDYAVSSWYMGLSKGNKSKLQIAQNKVVRFILNLHPRSTIGQNELDRLGMLNTGQRAKQMILNHVFNIKHMQAPTYMYQNFNPIRHQYSTRGSKHNYEALKPIGVTSGNFSYNGVKLWNDLPTWIKTIDDKNLFKRKVKAHLRTL